MALEASAVADPHITVKADVERLLDSPLLSPKVSVSGHVYDIATGRVATTVDAVSTAGKSSTAAVKRIQLVVRAGGDPRFPWISQS